VRAQRLGEPSLAIKAASSPRGDSTLTYASPAGRKSLCENLEVEDDASSPSSFFSLCGRNHAGASARIRPSVRNLAQRLPDNLQAFPHLGHANQITARSSRIRSRRHIEVKLFVTRVRKKLSGYRRPMPAAAQRWTRHAERDRIFRGDAADALGRPIQMRLSSAAFRIRPRGWASFSEISRGLPASCRRSSAVRDSNVTGHHPLAANISKIFRISSRSRKQ